VIRQKLKASLLIQGAHGAKPNTWTGVLVMPLRGLENGFGSFGTFKGVASKGSQRKICSALYNIKPKKYHRRQEFAPLSWG